MYHVSREMYRAIAPEIDPEAGRRGHEAVLRSCEQCMVRLFTDRNYFARPVRTLFNDIRTYFPITAQAHVWHVVSTYIAAADAWLARQSERGFDVTGEPLRCRATTRRGGACQRTPLPDSGYCPSHRHLGETDEVEVAAASNRGATTSSTDLEAVAA